MLSFTQGAMRGIVICLCVLLLLPYCTLSAVRITNTHTFSTAYYPPINKLHVKYPVEYINSAQSQTSYGATLTYMQLDPVNTATSVTAMSNVCRSIPPTPFPFNTNGHCFATCSQSSIDYTDDPFVAAQRAPFRRQIEQITCQKILSSSNDLQQTLLQRIQSTQSTFPEFYTINCTTGRLQSDWYKYSVPPFDAFSLRESLGAQGMPDPNTLNNVPNCFESASCYKTTGLPKMAYDGASSPIEMNQQSFYCCTNTTAGTEDYSVLSNTTCVSTLTASDAPTKNRALLVCKRSIQIHQDGTDPITGLVKLKWTTNPFKCDVQCTWPYVTAHRGLSHYSPQPTHNQCSTPTFNSLCTWDASANAASICQANEQLIGIHMYKASDMALVNTTFLQGSVNGVFARLNKGPLSLSTKQSDLFLRKTWRYCNVGETGCVPYCHCFNGCKQSLQCNQHGTLWESPQYGVKPVCMCEDGYSGNTCEIHDGNQLCNTAARTSRELDALYHS
jgi:hypothetical protein